MVTLADFALILNPVDIGMAYFLDGGLAFGLGGSLLGFRLIDMDTPLTRDIDRSGCEIYIRYFFHNIPPELALLSSIVTSTLIMHSSSPFTPLRLCWMIYPTSKGPMQ